MSGNYDIGYSKPPEGRPFVKGDSRRVNKPVGARERQITTARKRLDKPVINENGVEITEWQALFELLIAEYKLNPKPELWKAINDYSGYKPSEHVEFNDITEPLKDEDRKESILMRLAALKSEEQNTVNEANSILEKQ